MPPLSKLLNRRRALGLLGTSTLAFMGVRCGLPRLLQHGPPEALPPELQAWVNTKFDDVDRAAVWDVHCHLVGRGIDSDCFVSPEMVSRLHPWKNFQFDLYAAAAGLSSGDGVADSAYLVRLLELHRLGNPAGRLVLLAFEQYVDDDGVEVRERSELFTPNEYVIAVGKEHGDVVVPGCSVHPYRKDAIERLERALDGGCRAVKWLPNAMNIDPASSRCDPFFAVLARRKVPLITHTGDESAVDARDLQAFGHPRRLERALDAGVIVVAAHVATTGLCDAATSCFDELVQMLDDPRWKARLFADISAVPQFNRAVHLPAMLRRRDLHERLLFGTDYPLPAIDPLISTRYLASQGLLDDDDRVRLNQVFPRNPLLFDYVLKRCLRVVDVDGTVHRFSPIVFETRRAFAAAS
ncbi:MAG: amidohydrolase family protein [Deltaproteobacteria bacterium]|nr:amidohydrolase family protein [Deltaproteobacteria bacterium]